MRETSESDKMKIPNLLDPPTYDIRIFTFNYIAIRQYIVKYDIEFLYDHGYPYSVLYISGDLQFLAPS